MSSVVCDSTGCVLEGSQNIVGIDNFSNVVVNDGGCDIVDCCTLVAGLQSDTCIQGQCSSADSSGESVLSTNVDVVEIGDSNLGDLGIPQSEPIVAMCGVSVDPSSQSDTSPDGISALPPDEYLMDFSPENSVSSAITVALFDSNGENQECVPSTIIDVNIDDSNLGILQSDPIVVMSDNRADLFNQTDVGITEDSGLLGSLISIVDVGVPDETIHVPYESAKVVGSNDTLASVKNGVDQSEITQQGAITNSTIPFNAVNGQKLNEHGEYVPCADYSSPVEIAVEYFQDFLEEWKEKFMTFVSLLKTEEQDRKRSDGIASIGDSERSVDDEKKELIDCLKEQLQSLICCFNSNVDEVIKQIEVNMPNVPSAAFRSFGMQLLDFVSIICRSQDELLGLGGIYQKNESLMPNKYGQSNYNQVSA